MRARARRSGHRRRPYAGPVKRAFSKPVLRFAALPGFASLEPANALAVQPGVEMSSPNWWVESVPQ